MTNFNEQIESLKKRHQHHIMAGSKLVRKTQGRYTGASDDSFSPLPVVPKLTVNPLRTQYLNTRSSMSRIPSF